MELLDYRNDPRAVLCHFNPNHDPRNGQFAESSGGSSGGSKTVDKSTAKKYNKDDKSSKSQSSDKWKTAVKVGAVAVGVSLAVIGGVYLAKSGKLDKYISAGKSMMSNVSNKASGKSQRIVGRSPEQINLKMISKINGPGAVEPSRQINCTHTTTAYILNSLFGKNVQALPFSGVDELSGRVSSGRGMNTFHALFDGINEIDLMEQHALPAKRTRAAIPNIHMDWMKGLKSLPPGTGILQVATDKGGHVVNYEKTAEGLITLIDPQANIIESGDMGVNAFRWGTNNGYRLIKALDLSNATLRENAAEILKNMVI